MSNVLYGKLASEPVIKNVYSWLLKFTSIFWAGVPISKVTSKSFWRILSGYAFSPFFDFIKGYLT